LSASINMKITGDGQAALFNAQNTGFELALTHIQFGSGNRLVDGSEVALIAPKQTAPMSPQGQRISPTQLRVSALFLGSAITTPYEINEIGIWAGEPGQTGSVLFAYWSQPSGNLAVMSVGVDFSWTHDMYVDAAVGGAVNIVVDPDASTAVVLLGQHESAPNPHPLLYQSIAALAAAQVQTMQRQIEHEYRLPVKA